MRSPIPFATPDGYDQASFPAGAPRTAQWLRNWRAELGDDTFARQKVVLKIRYAIDKGFEPGLWRPADIETLPADGTFAGRLRNFGFAVGVPQSFPAA